MCQVQISILIQVNNISYPSSTCQPVCISQFCWYTLEFLSNTSHHYLCFYYHIYSFIHFSSISLLSIFPVPNLPPSLPLFLSFSLLPFSVSLYLCHRSVSVCSHPSFPFSFRYSFLCLRYFEFRRISQNI